MAQWFANPLTVVQAPGEPHGGGLAAATLVVHQRGRPKPFPMSQLASANSNGTSDPARAEITVLPMPIATSRSESVIFPILLHLLSGSKRTFGTHQQISRSCRPLDPGPIGTVLIPAEHRQHCLMARDLSTPRRAPKLHLRRGLRRCESVLEQIQGPVTRGRSKWMQPGVGSPSLGQLGTPLRLCCAARRPAPDAARRDRCACDGQRKMQELEIVPSRPG